MKKIVLIIIMLIGVNTFAFTKPKDFLGIFTTDSYPVSGCLIEKVGKTISVVGSFERQNLSNDRDIKKEIKYDAESGLMFSLERKARKQSFNAVIGYQFDMFGFYNGYGPQIVNGSAGKGFYTSVARGVPVLVKCK